ncbi:MAG: hypothetical protein WCJ30_10595 [Deltaproteobacteria bacterium]
MRKASFVVPFLFGVALAACGPDNGLGFYAGGNVRATVTDNGVTTTGFDIAQSSRVDPTLPSGATTGFTGTCQIGPNGRSLRLQQVGGNSLGMTEMSLTMPAWDQDTCTNCLHGTLTTIIGGVTFTGTEQRGATTPTACTFTTDRRGSFGMQVHMGCTALSATGDPRRVDISSDLTLDECDGPSTNGP